MGYCIKETAGGVTVEIGYNTLEELQARLREIDPTRGPSIVEACSKVEEPREPEEHKGLFLVYWPGTDVSNVGTAWLHKDLEEALADIKEADCGIPEVYELGKRIPLIQNVFRKKTRR